MQRAGIMRKTGNDVEVASLVTNHIIDLPKKHVVKLVAGAECLDSITDMSNYSWLLQPVKMLLSRLDGV